MSGEYKGQWTEHEMIHGYFENFDGVGLMHCAYFWDTVHGRSAPIIASEQNEWNDKTCKDKHFKLITCFLY